MAELAARSSARESRWILAGLAAEAGCARPPNGRARFECAAGEPPLDSGAQRFLERAGPQATGPGLEPKLRVLGFELDPDGTLCVRFSPSTWERGRGFHMALLACDAPPPESESWLAAAFCGAPLVPGLAAVHGAVVTSDAQLVLMRRSAGVLYRPLHWAATFEEQMIAADLSAPDALERAVLRGLHEELGVAAGRARTRFLTALIELETLNIAFLSRVDVAASAREVRELCAGAPDAHDADSVAFVPAEPAVLRALVSSGGRPGHAPLHPTSALRLEALARHLLPARP